MSLSYFAIYQIAKSLPNM